MKCRTSSNGKARTSEHEPDAIGGQLCDRVRQLRKKKGWTLEQLSAACGVSRSMLSQIERNQANPTLGVAFRIAQAFGMSLGNLVDVPNATPSIDVIRAHDRTYHYRQEKDCRLRTLSPLHLEKDVEFYEFTLKPAGVCGARRISAVRGNSKPCSRERCGPAATTTPASCTAAIPHYPADVPHSIENVGKQEAVMFLVDIYRGG